MTRVRLNQLDPELQAIATEDYTFHNWAKTFQCTCEIMFQPSTESQVVKVRKEKKKISRFFPKKKKENEGKLYPT